MKYKAKYAAEADIPAEVKAFYSLVGGEWVFDNEFEGLAELLNPGLATNRDALRTEKEKAEATVTAEKKRADEAEVELGKLKKPGTVLLTEVEKQKLDEYEKLGAPKDIAEKLEKGTAASEKLSSYETEKEIRQLAKDTGVDEEALVDFKLNSTHGTDVVLGKETKKVKVGNKEIQKEILVVVHTDKVNDKEVTKNIEFSVFAKDKRVPNYLVQGIFSSGVDETVNGKKKEVKKEFYVPPTTVETVKDDKSDAKSSANERVKKLNRGALVRRMPWEPAEVVTK